MKQVYLILAALLLLCLAPMPYGYYMMVRFVALALLFQPMCKIALGHTIWNIVDVIVAVLLIALYVMEGRQEKKES